MKATLENVTAVIVKADVLTEVEELDSGLPLADQGMDSLDMYDFYLLLEEEFDIKIPDDDIDKVLTINAIVEYINSKE